MTVKYITGAEFGRNMHRYSELLLSRCVAVLVFA